MSKHGYLTPDEKQHELALFKQTIEQWRSKGSPDLPGTPDEDMLPICEQINAHDGIVTLQSCKGHIVDGAIWSGHLHLWMDQKTAEEFRSQAQWLAEQPWVESVCEEFRPLARVFRMEFALGAWEDALPAWVNAFVSVEKRLEKIAALPEGPYDIPWNPVEQPGMPELPEPTTIWGESQIDTVHVPVAIERPTVLVAGDVFGVTGMRTAGGREEPDEYDEVHKLDDTKLHALFAQFAAHQDVLFAIETDSWGRVREWSQSLLKNLILLKESKIYAPKPIFDHWIDIAHTIPGSRWPGWPLPNVRWVNMTPARTQAEVDSLWSMSKKAGVRHRGMRVSPAERGMLGTAIGETEYTMGCLRLLEILGPTDPSEPPLDPEHVGHLIEQAEAAGMADRVWLDWGNKDYCLPAEQVGAVAEKHGPMRIGDALDLAAHSFNGAPYQGRWA